MSSPGTGHNPHSAVIYLRISQDRVGDEAGVTRQREDCEQLCRERGWTVVAVEEDNDTEAKSGRKRRGFEALLQYIESGQADRVVAWTLDRLQRNKRDEVRLYELCADRAVRVSLVRGPELEWETPMGRWLADNLGSQARLEVEMKGDRHKRANQQRRDRGHMGWTRRPFGYARCPEGKIIVVEEEAAGLREAAQVVLTGGTLQAACRSLEARGLTTTIGGAWTVTTLRRLLLSPRHAGRVTYNKKEYGVAGTWPPIFTEEEHVRLVDMLADPARRMAQSTEARYMLSGVARCGRCGSIMRGSPMSSKGRRWHVYKCGTKGCRMARRSDLVDQTVTAVLLDWLARPDTASLLVPHVNMDALREEAASLRDRREVIGDLIEDGHLSINKGRERIAGLTAKLQDVERQIGRAVADSPAAPLVDAADPAVVWEDMPVRARKALIDYFMTVEILPAGKGARFHPDQVRITWRPMGQPA